MDIHCRISEHVDAHYQARSDLLCKTVNDLADIVTPDTALADIRDVLHAAQTTIGLRGTDPEITHMARAVFNRKMRAWIDAQSPNFPAGTLKPLEECIGEKLFLASTSAVMSASHKAMQSLAELPPAPKRQRHTEDTASVWTVDTSVKVVVARHFTEAGARLYDVKAGTIDKVPRPGEHAVISFCDHMLSEIKVIARDNSALQVVATRTKYGDVFVPKYTPDDTDTYTIRKQMQCTEPFVKRLIGTGGQCVHIPAYSPNAGDTPVNLTDADVDRASEEFEACTLPWP